MLGCVVCMGIPARCMAGDLRRQREEALKPWTEKGLRCEVLLAGRHNAARIRVTLPIVMVVQEPVGVVQQMQM